MKNFTIEAVGIYKRNTGNLPEQIVIYRDGMGGPSMTALVADYEVKLIT